MMQSTRKMLARRAISLLAAGLLVMPVSASANPVLVLNSSISSSLMTMISSGSLCIVYTYDANGNRISQTSSTFGSPGAIWGSGVLGCFNWTS